MLSRQEHMGHEPWHFSRESMAPGTQDVHYQASYGKLEVP
jgi:hypothetical protein